MPTAITPAKWYERQSDESLICHLCPRECRLRDGDRGFCFVRQNVSGEMVLDTYGKSTGFCIDPIEKKPLNHFLPGTPVLSFGTAGCNLGCKFCQNWDISKSREVARLSERAMPDDIAAAAMESQCRSVAFTYNDPVIWAEYAIDTASACRDRGIKSVAVTAGYISEQARPEFFLAMDAANIDLKAFSESFYYRVTGSHLQPVLDTISYACNETNCWVELTNLIIPNTNDDPGELQRMCDWLVANVGTQVPIHFTAFHPDFRFQEEPRTSHETLISAYELARQAGLQYVYVGNIQDVQRQSTYCHQCGVLLIERDWHEIGRYTLDGNRCRSCEVTVPGVFDDEPGRVAPGNWGRKRQSIKIQSQAPPEPTPETFMIQKPDETVADWSPEERLTIHTTASRFVTAFVLGESTDEAERILGNLAARSIHGIYVTLKRGDTLRGCCGLQGGAMPLGTSLADAAKRTTRDPRMPAISSIELPYLTLTVSILGPLRPIGVSGDLRVEHVEIGRHGLRLQVGQNAGLLLPSVATEQGWNARQFLDAVCRKAGVPAGTWRSEQAQLMLFDGIHFGGGLEIGRADEDASPIDGVKPSDPLTSADQLESLTNWVRRTVHAKDPTGTESGIAESAVSGYMLRLILGEKSSSWLQLSLRDKIALQGSLENTLRNAQSSFSSESAQGGPDEVALAILTQPIHHGDVASADLRGVHPHSRAVIATDGRRWSVRFDRDETIQATLARVLAAERFHRASTQIYTAHCDCNVPALGTALGPAAEPEITVRPPAVAGRFYNASDEGRIVEVAELLRGLPDVEKRPVHAAMVPHAGLRFSGTVAAEVWRRIQLPRDVLIIGPKHTNAGVDWAVAPHRYWQLSATSGIEGNAELASSLASCHEGLELDAAAHRDEHGIEIQLPLLHHLAPETRVTAIAMRSARIEELQELAASLAQWMRSLDSPPLLVISSDMNHFADDLENRRRDRMALDALSSGDAAALLQTCESENISMCGQVPAALVLLTLQELEMETRYDEIAYGTSAEFGGDPNRVVGYAGVLF